MWTAFSDPARPRTGYHARAYRSLERGGTDDYFESLVVTDEDASDGVARGSLVSDTRLRDALRQLRDEDGSFAGAMNGGSPLRLPVPSVVDDAAYAADIAAFDEANVIRARRELDRLEARLSSVERRLGQRVARRISRLVRRPERGSAS